MKKIVDLFNSLLTLVGLKQSKKHLDMFVMLERLTPWIVLKCLEKDNYIITESQAQNLADIILNQAKKMNALEIVFQ